MKLPGSLQGRLLVMVLGLVVAVWLATAVMTWFDVRHELDELLDSHLAQAAALLVVQQARELDDGDDHHIDAPTLHRYAPKVAFQVWHEGRLARRSANAPAGPMTPLRKRFKTGFETVEIDGRAWRVFAAPGAERDVQVYVGEQVVSRASIAWAVLRSMLWPMAVALPLLALAAWWAVRQGVAPLRKLGGTLAARDPRALESVMMDGVPSEMAPMLDALNSLFERIGALMESERRFTADAAHELRTPIAAIRTQAQVALGEEDRELRRHALQATLEGCDRATRLVEQLLTLSRLDAGVSPPLTSIDFGAYRPARTGRAGAKGGAEGADACVRCSRAVRGARERGAACSSRAQSGRKRHWVQPAECHRQGGRRRSRQPGPADGRGQRTGNGRAGPCAARGTLLPRARERPKRQRPGLVDPAAGRGEIHRANVHVERSDTLGGLRVVIDLPRHS